MRLENIVAAFAPAAPELARRRALLRRVDTKFVAHRTQLAAILEPLVADYSALARLSSYRTLYFDTDDLCLYRDHRRDRRPRQKVRIRHYDDLGESFVEIKTKRDDGLTVKYREAIGHGDDHLPLDLLEGPSQIAPGRLLPQIWTNFRRLTLVGLATCERVTIDVDLRFVRGAESIAVDDQAIVEVKQPTLSTDSPIWRALRSVSARPRSISKYCTGTAMLARAAPQVREIAS